MKHKRLIIFYCPSSDASESKESAILIVMLGQEVNTGGGW